MANYKSDSLDHLLQGSMADRLQKIAGKEVLRERKPRLAIATQTGVLSLDLETGGGLPAGLIEIYGEESVGKTALLAQLLSFAQRTGLTTMLLATEMYDAPYYTRLGVMQQELILIPGGMPNAHNVALRFLEDHQQAVLAIDSISALPFDRHDSWNEGALWFLEELAIRTGTRKCVVAVSQVRAKRSADHRRVFGAGTESASRRLTDLFALRLELSREQVKASDYTLIINVVRNVLAMPASIIEVPARKGSGIDVHLDLIRVAERLGLLKRKGPKVYFGLTYLGIGEKGAAETIAYDDDMQLKLVRTIMERVHR